VTDDKADNITKPEDEVATTANPDAQPTEAQAEPGAGSPDAGTEENKLGGLMAESEVPTAKAAAKPAVNLEADAMRAAEEALAEGEKALAEANAQLQEDATPKVTEKPKSRVSREMVLRVLLAVNVLAMIAVAMIPAPAKVEDNVDPVPVVVPQPKGPAVRQMSEPVNRAWQASENRDFARAVAILEAYLQDNPRMHSAERLSVMTALSHYASRDSDFAKSQKYAQQARALEQSHSLPEDLVHMAEAAVKNGDQESLRRIWARFLLQQQQVPTWLYQHVAQAYLQLGDSYRKDADAADEAARRKELNDAAARLRAEAIKFGGGK
tara:strand:- start:83092 stop:84063 length:972 start_codon:yes stop_codon:yes gene_type:complete